MTEAELVETLKNNFPNVWSDDGLEDRGVKVYRCTENDAHPYGKVVSFAIVDGEEVPNRWLEKNIHVGLKAYEDGQDTTCVGYGWFSGYGKIGRSL